MRGVIDYEPEDLVGRIVGWRTTYRLCPQNIKPGRSPWQPRTMWGRVSQAYRDEYGVSVITVDLSTGRHQNHMPLEDLYAVMPESY